jgi:hypothetical protein
VLSGAAMAVASTQKELQDFLKNAGEVSHFCNSTSYTLYKYAWRCTALTAYTLSRTAMKLSAVGCCEVYDGA